MIIVNRNWLRMIGMPQAVVAALEETSGLMLSDLTSFAGGMGGSRYTTALVQEPAPRTLLLLGMADRYGAADGMGCSIIELGVDSDVYRRPSPNEQQTALEALESVDHPTSSAIATAIRRYAEVESAAAAAAERAASDSGGKPCG